MYDTSNPPVFQAHPNAKSVIAIHNFNWMFVQATVAILILVGFESVHLARRRGEKRQTGRSDRGHHLTAGSGGVLLSVRVFRRKLLLK